MSKVKVNASNLTEQQDTTLIRAFDKLDEVDTDDTEKVIKAVQFQAKIGQELERRGWTYDEDACDWVHTL